MLYLGLLKRIIPFVLTFAAGLLLASFFVPIGWQSALSSERRSRCHKHRMIMQENADLKDEIRRLNERINSAEARAHWYRDGLMDVPAPVIPDIDPPPPPPVKPARTLR